MTCALPKACLKKIQNIQIGFKWGDSEKGKHIHSMKCKTITKPKHMGGLGLRNLDEMDNAYFLKLIWKLKNGDNFV